jgi:hypothetical protein
MLRRRHSLGISIPEPLCQVRLDLRTRDVDPVVQRDRVTRARDERTSSRHLREAATAVRTRKKKIEQRLNGFVWFMMGMGLPLLSVTPLTVPVTKSL